MTDRDRVIGGAYEDRSEAEILRDLYARLLVELGLAAVFGVWLKRSPAGWQVMAGRHDDQPLDTGSEHANGRQP